MFYYLHCSFSNNWIFLSTLICFQVVQIETNFPVHIEWPTLHKSKKKDVQTRMPHRRTNKHKNKNWRYTTTQEKWSEQNIPSRIQLLHYPILNYKIYEKCIIFASFFSGFWRGLSNPLTIYLTMTYLGQQMMWRIKVHSWRRFTFIA